MRILEELIISIHDGLRETGVTKEDALYQAIGNIAFSVAAIIDGSRVMELNGEPVVPVGTDLIAAEGGSWFHEYVFSSIDDVFESGNES